MGHDVLLVILLEKIIVLPNSKPTPAYVLCRFKKVGLPCLARHPNSFVSANRRVIYNVGWQTQKQTLLAHCVSVLASNPR